MATSKMGVSDFDKDHPERMDDEVYLGNFDNEDARDCTGRTTYQCVGWKTKRRGSIAYDIHGVPLGSRWRGAFPVFAKQSEINAKDPEILDRLLPKS